MHNSNPHNSPNSKAPSEDIEARRARYNADREGYLLSPFFQRQCIRTPYGFSEINSTAGAKPHGDHYQLHFVPHLADLNDKKKVIYNFKRYQAYEPMRIKAERALQSRFPHYHAKYGMYLESWLFGSVCINEALTTPASNERHYVMYWQLQKSTLLWILVHALFALNATLNDLMLEDLLWFITHDLDRFIECGLCHAHWTADNGGQFEWRQHEERFMQHNRSRRDLSAGLLNRSMPFQAPLQYNFDLTLFFTHNAVQTQRINAATGLTNAALNALKRDYAHFAGAFIGCLAQDSDKHIKNTTKYPHPVPFRCSIYDFEYKRRDICHTAEHLYLPAMKNSTDIQQMADDDEAIVSCSLALQRRQIDTQLRGH